MAGSLGDQLLKMGLVNEKQAKKARHEQRQENKKRGRQGVEDSRMDRRAALIANQENQRQKDRTRELSRQEKSDKLAEQHRLLQIVRSGVVKGRTGGRRRFYYESRDGRVPYLEVNDEVLEALEAGAMALAEDLDGRTSIIDRSSAARIAEIDPNWLALWNGSRNS